MSDIVVSQPVHEHICGIEFFPRQVCKFFTNKVGLRYISTLATWPEPQVQSLFMKAAAIWADVADIRFRPMEWEATIEAQTCRIDGPRSVLAWSTMPCAGERTARQCYDDSERWVDSESPGPGQIDVVTVMAHELGHALGLPHAPFQGNLMYAAYTGPFRQLGIWDRQEIVQRYGARPGGGPSPPPGPGGPDVDDVLRLVCLIGRPILDVLCRRFPDVGGVSDSGMSGSTGCCSREAAALLREIAARLQTEAQRLERRW